MANLLVRIHHRAVEHVLLFRRPFFSFTLDASRVCCFNLVLSTCPQHMRSCPAPAVHAAHLTPLPAHLTTLDGARETTGYEPLDERGGQLFPGKPHVSKPTRRWPVGQNDCVPLLFCTIKGIFVRISERELTFEVTSPTHLGELTFKNLDSG